MHEKTDKRSYVICFRELLKSFLISLFSSWKKSWDILIFLSFLLEKNFFLSCHFAAPAPIQGLSGPRFMTVLQSVLGVPDGHHSLITFGLLWRKTAILIGCEKTSKQRQFRPKLKLNFHSFLFSVVVFPEFVMFPWTLELYTKKTWMEAIRTSCTDKTKQKPRKEQTDRSFLLTVYSAHLKKYTLGQFICNNKRNRQGNNSNVHFSEGITAVVFFFWIHRQTAQKFSRFLQLVKKWIKR